MSRSSALAGALLCGALLLLAACQPPASTPSDDAAGRGHDPWVFRSVLDWQPRMVTVALNDSLWVAYHADEGAVYKVWRDGVKFDGPVYTTAHGPQPISLGDAYLVSPYETPWQVRRGEATERPHVQYLGHRFEDGRVHLRYALHLAGGTTIEVTESPEYVRDEAGHPGLERVFTTTGVPEGTDVAVQLHLNSLRDADAATTDGRFELTPTGGASTDGFLVLTANGATRHTAFFQPEPQVPVLRETDDEDARPLGLVLIEGSDCQTCHNAEVETVGPAYKAIAERYPFTDYMVTSLARKIIEGGSGVWGERIMTAHPDLEPEQAQEMVRYILALDGEEPSDDNPFSTGTSYRLFESVAERPGNQGLALNAYRFAEPIEAMPDPGADVQPVYSGVVPAIHAFTREDFGGLSEHFYIEATGTLTVPADNNYVFRLVSDDGSLLEIDGDVVVDHGGLHGADAKDGEMWLTAGQHPIRFRYFQSGGGKAVSLQWVAHGDSAFTVIPPEVFTYDDGDLREARAELMPTRVEPGAPGDGRALEAVHPSFDLSTIRPSTFEPKVGGMDFLSDGRLVVSTWDPDGSVYVVSNLDASDSEQVEVQRIAKGLAEPLGLKVVDDEIYVLQKQELTKLIDHDGDGLIDEYRTVANDWGATANFHEFAFGLVYEDGYFYGTLATAIDPGGASTQPQNPDRGTVLRIDPATGEVTFIAHGLRTPNGIGHGVDGALYVADNQGDWLPSSKIVRVEEGAWYGSRSVDPEGTASLTETPPVVWLPQDEIGNSPSQPAPLNVGPYQNQMVHGEVTHGGLKRVFAEEIDGVLQGAVFRFTQGLEAGVNRVIVGPDGAYYIGGIGNPGNWGHMGKQWYGLQRLAYNGQPAFEMLAVRARTGGMEIEFTEPLRAGDGHDPAGYLVKQWYYEPTAAYGGPKLDETTLEVERAVVSADRRKVFLEMPGLKDGHVVYVRLRDPLISEGEQELWTTEAWYTLNRVPQDRPGPSFADTAPYEPAPPNGLTAEEEAAGWQRLFDGETLGGWRGYRKAGVPSAWRAEDGTLAFVPGEGEGGDLITEAAYEDFELELEWKISRGGNSGIFYNVVEDSSYDYVWQTGPEMQVLDDRRHPDGQIQKHRAGDLYDLIESRVPAARTPGEWNHVRIVQRDGQVQHWLNGRKVVDFAIGTPEWEALVEGSKFADMPGFGRATSGHIALQDHGDRVWYRNLKIREL